MSKLDISIGYAVFDLNQISVRGLTMARHDCELQRWMWWIFRLLWARSIFICCNSSFFLKFWFPSPYQSSWIKASVHMYHTHFTSFTRRLTYFSLRKFSIWVGFCKVLCLVESLCFSRLSYRMDHGDLHDEVIFETLLISRSEVWLKIHFKDLILPL